MGSMAARVARFHDDHAESERIAREPFWDDLYAAAFPGFIEHAIEERREEQRREIDRRVTTSHFGTMPLRIEEKYDTHTTGNFFLEFWSVKERRVRGWVARDDLGSDYLAYLFTKLDDCYFIPMVGLRAAWARQGREWCDTYGTKDVPNDGYTTSGCPVPTWVVTAAVDHCFRMRLATRTWVRQLV